MSAQHEPNSHATAPVLSPEDMSALEPGARAVELTRFVMHQHYRENDLEPVIELMDDELRWFGAAEAEHSVSVEYVANLFRQFVGKVPLCNIWDEEYDEPLKLAPGCYLVTCRYWVATDPSTKVSIRCHQRLSMVWRDRGTGLRWCHLHLSNPYIDMVEGDVGFPTKVSRETYEYLQEQVEDQRRQIEEQTAELTSIYDTVPCAILRFRRTDGVCEPLFMNRAVAGFMGVGHEEVGKLDWTRGTSPFMDDDDAAKLHAALAELKEPGDQVEMVCRIHRADGRTSYVTSNNTLISADERGGLIQKIVFDVTERIQMEEALARTSFEDTLTGLFNRNRFNHEMRDGGYRDAARLGVAYFDINGLKAMNDTHGHAAGDDLIVRTARHIVGEFAGKAYRIGGDEYVVIVSDIDEGEFIRRIERVRSAMEADGISISAGWSWRSEGCDVERQYEEADRLMYAEKARYYSSRQHDRRSR